MNPEFQRNLWLEATPFRLALIAGLLVLVFAAVFVTHGAIQPQGVAAGLYFFFAVLWGTRSAALSVVGEIRERTWDSQKLSSIGPVEMVWGKLFGATIHTWFGALICLPFILWPVAADNGIGVALDYGATLLAIGVMAQAVALLASLMLIRRRTGNWRLDTFLCQVAGVMAALVYEKLVDSPRALMSVLPISWWGHDFSISGFTQFSLFVMTAWALVGCWRAMRAELRFTNGPFLWLAWLLFLALYQAGFEHLLGTGFSMAGKVQFDVAGHVALKLLLAVAALMASAYAMVFLEPKDTVRLRWLGEQLRAGQPVRAFLALDTWMLSYGAVLVVGFAAAALLVVSTGWIGTVSLASLSLPMLAMLGFLTRDIAIFVLAGRVGGGKGDFAAIAILAALYLLVPIILKPVAPQLMALFVPVPGNVLSLIAAWLQGVVAVLFALRNVARNA